MLVNKVKNIVFRKLTDADFFHINKKPGTESGGGGQSYIDISTSSVNITEWQRFFGKIVPDKTKNGPMWTFTVNSLGVNKSQKVIIGQRRETTFSIRSQKIYSKYSNRIYAWHPKYIDFPMLKDPLKKERVYDLIVYIVSLENGTYWAGWFQKSKPDEDWPINEDLNEMFIKNSGMINSSNILFDTNDPSWPFRIKEREKSGEIKKKVKSLFKEKDDLTIIEELFTEDLSPDMGLKQKELTRTIRIRNQKIVSLLKKLYRGTCQITGKTTFKKKDGNFYLEAHHLIPLGKGGSDSPFNLIVINPLIHRMLHYANVSPIDVSKLKNNTLKITINGIDHLIRWHPKHAEIVSKSLS